MESDSTNDVSNNIDTSFFYVLAFYIISIILLIGVIFNIILLSKYGESFKIKFLKRLPIINILMKILLWLSVFYFPITVFYLFTKFYVYKSTKLF